jgi:hypothetical protein
LSSSHTIPEEPERRNVPLDRCSPAIDLHDASRDRSAEEKLCLRPTRRRVWQARPWW